LNTLCSDGTSKKAVGSEAAAFALARLAWDAAPKQCRRAGLRCEAYHQVRPMLRRLGLAAEPEDQRAFLFPAMVAALRDVGSHVLISGSVDEAMAAMVVEAGTFAQRSPTIIVVDRCMTPLLVNQAYAQSFGVELTTVQSDIFAFRAPRPFDVIATHSFFSSIAPADRPRLMAKWCESLRPGGRVITVARLRPENETRSFASGSPERLAAELRARATMRMQEIGLTPEDLANAAVRYAKERIASFPVRDLSEIVNLFEGGGFRMLHVATRQWPGRVTGIEGPGLPRGGLYAEVVAERS
jgi:SAM-dependent methyltransferase